VGPLEAVEVIRRAVASSPYAPYFEHIYSRVLDGALYYTPSLPPGSAFEFSGYVFVNPAGDPSDLAFLLVASANRAVLRKSWGVLTAIYSHFGGFPALVASELALSAHASWRAAALVDKSALARVRSGAPVPRELPALFPVAVSKDMIWNLHMKVRIYHGVQHRHDWKSVSRAGSRYFPPPGSPEFVSLVKEISETMSSAGSTWDWNDSSIAVVNALTERKAWPSMDPAGTVTVSEASFYVAICTDRCLKKLLSESYLLPSLGRQSSTTDSRSTDAKGLLGIIISKIVSRVLGRGSTAVGTDAVRVAGTGGQGRAGSDSGAHTGQGAEAGELRSNWIIGDPSRATDSKRTADHEVSGTRSRGAGSASSKGVSMEAIFGSSTRGVEHEGNRGLKSASGTGHTDLVGTNPRAESSLDWGASTDLYEDDKGITGGTSRDVGSTISSSPGLFGSASSGAPVHRRSSPNPVIIPSDIAQKIAIALPEIANVVDIRIPEAHQLRGGESENAFEEPFQSWKKWVRGQHYGVAKHLEHSLTKTVEGYLRARGAKISKTISDYAMVAWAFPNVRARMRKPGTKYLQGRRVEPPLLLLLVDVSGSMGLYTELHKEVILSVARKFKLNGYQIFWETTVVDVRPLYDESGNIVVPEAVHIQYGGTFIDPALMTAKRILKRLKKKDYILVIFSDLETYRTSESEDLLLDLVLHSIRTYFVVPPIFNDTLIKHLIKKQVRVAKKIKMIKAGSLVESAHRSGIP